MAGHAIGGETLPSHAPLKDPNSFFLVLKATLGTALFRIWPNLLFMGAWSTMVCLINKKLSVKLVVAPTLLTVLGTILGLVLAYRTSTAYERYWEGRRLWSQIIINARCWSRIVWIHCPDTRIPSGSTPAMNVDEDTRLEIERKDKKGAQAEKRTVIGLTLAFAVAVKHYLRGEDGIYYEDLFYLVRFLPGYNIPGVPHPPTLVYQRLSAEKDPFKESDVLEKAKDATIRSRTRFARTDSPDSLSKATPMTSLPPLKPAMNPPRTHVSDMWPLSLTPWAKRKRRSRKTDQRTRAEFDRKRRRNSEVKYGQHSIPLEITLYMSSYVAALQRRKLIDVPTTNCLLGSLNSFNEVLASLERILTTPLPFSYAAHIWVVCWVYCLLLPFQVYELFGYLTIAASVCTTFILTGLISLGQEIENPFGYDANDLPLDFFCESIIKPEIDAIMARPPADPADWVFDDANVMTKHTSLSVATRLNEHGISPEDLISPA